MAPFIKAYHDDDKIKEAIEILKSNKVDSKEIYVITHDDDRTKRIADNSGANVIGMSEQGVADAVKTSFRKKGDELRNKLESVGFDENQAVQYEAQLDKGVVYLIVTEAYGVDLDAVLA
ncbi:General stress protein 17M [Jeotgalicoccus saudimassiliensis]|uniref:General stress protein 17M n=1 Tax=Jeotgalicoccus saudimassiliensis TaxID=1461582 RepID=A0A078LZ31_9STAP|nr:general stress protein [Jeotgalicoccus saudimassiliensis]CEA00363.1 General stress protein 17M [Jeotgalicoccus saudimassiliensis]